MQPDMFIPWVGMTFLVVFTVMAIVGVVVKIYGVKAGLDKFVRRAVERAGNLLLTMGLIGLLIYFFTFEHVPILSMRLWLLVWLLSALAWVWSIARYVRVDIPAKRELMAERERLNKWIPKPKR